MVDDAVAEREIAAIMGRFLAAVSFPAGARPSYDDLHDLFVDGARLVKNSGSAPEISSLDQFIAARVETIDDGRLTSFEEVEIAAITEVFGNVAHRLSSYQKRGTTDGAPIDARGAISTQLIRTPQGWRITSMAWDDERPGLELPSRYLGAEL
jgi:hypothetical protein